MKTSTTAGIVGYLAAVAAAAKDSRTFAVLRFNGDGFLTEGRMDPVVNPGEAATHYHSIMGGSNFDVKVDGEQLLDSNCTTAKIANDFSNYWIPSLFFQDPKDESKFTKVPALYMNVYYFFEPTNDEVKAFPPGLKMLIGDVHQRNPPKSARINLDPNQGEIQPVQWVCPRTSYSPASYPANSDGTKAGMQDPDNQQAGAGFPLYPCDALGAPLRQDIHFPSCYNPQAGLDDYKNNMAWPRTGADGKQDCPEGHVHVPHMFYEVYWNTPLFSEQWTPDGVSQPFVLSNGDRTGYSSHADFIAGWDTHTLQTIIDTCNAGTIGMDSCPQIPGGLNTNNNCRIEPMIPEEGISLASNSADQSMSRLPGDNPVTGWGKGNYSPASESESESQSSSSSGSGSGSSSDSGSNAAPAEAPAPPASQPAADAPVPSLADVVEDSAEKVSEAASPVVDAANSVETVWDVVTAIVTETAYAQPARRSHRHGHMARHARHAGRP